MGCGASSTAGNAVAANVDSAQDAVQQSAVDRGMDAGKKVITDVKGDAADAAAGAAAASDSASGAVGDTVTALNVKIDKGKAAARRMSTDENAAHQALLNSFKSAVEGETPEKRFERVMAERRAREKKRGNKTATAGGVPVYTAATGRRHSMGSYLLHSDHNIDVIRVPRLNDRKTRAMQPFAREHKSVLSRFYVKDVLPDTGGVVANANDYKADAATYRRNSQTNFPAIDELAGLGGDAASDAKESAEAAAGDAKQSAADAAAAAAAATAEIIARQEPVEYVSLGMRMNRRGSVA